MSRAFHRYVDKNTPGSLREMSPITGGRVADASRARTRRFGTGFVAILCWSCVGGAPVLAGELALGAGYSMLRDSNLTRVPTDPIADWTQTLIGGIAYQENTVDVNARLLAQVENRSFVNNTFPDDNGFYLEGAGVWTLLPRQFVWTVEDIFREVLRDISAVDVPTNRAKANSLSTGPDFTFRLNPSNTSVVGTRYGRFDIEGPGDNERVAAYARWLLQASAEGTFSLNYEVMRTDFEPPATFTQSVREDRFIRYFTRPALDATTIDFGTTRVRPKGGEEMNGRLARLSTARLLTPDSTLRVLLADEISDTYSDMLLALGSLTGSTPGGTLTPLQGSSLATADVYRSRRGDLTYANQDSRFGYTLQGYARRIDFEQLNQDSKEKGGRLEGSWLYSGDTRFHANADYVRRTFLSFERTDVERNSRVGVTYRLTRELSLVAEGARTETESTSPTANFVSRRAMLLFAYSTGPLYAVRPRR